MKNSRSTETGRRFAITGIALVLLGIITHILFCYFVYFVALPLLTEIDVMSLDEKKQLPAVEEIKALTAFLPLLYAEAFLPVLSWEGGGNRKDGTYSLSYPTYHPLVEQFFRLAASKCWLDCEYNPEQAYRMLRDENVFKNASLAEIKSMLTFCVRGERFSDGHWAEMIEKDYIRRLLERLNVIKSELPNENS